LGAHVGHLLLAEQDVEERRGHAQGDGLAGILHIELGGGLVDFRLLHLGVDAVAVEQHHARAQAIAVEADARVVEGVGGGVDGTAKLVARAHGAVERWQAAHLVLLGGQVGVAGGQFRLLHGQVVLPGVLYAAFEAPGGLPVQCPQGGEEGYSE